MDLFIPESYDSKLSVKQTQLAIQQIREAFQNNLGNALNLNRVSAPMFVLKNTGLNDNLNGVESPVSFQIKDIPGEDIEVVHSLAKWKRNALGRFGFEVGSGLYTNMNAIRKDEELDNVHSIYVDQWDWERVIDKSERHFDTLKETVRKIFKAIKQTQAEVAQTYGDAIYALPDDITFITTQELEDRYPELTPKERENAITKELGAVFLMQIGGKLKSGEPHDGRAPDYDDWQLNGDILFWFEPLQSVLEISSMGIRVDEDSLKEQLAITGLTERADLPYHHKILNQELPYTIGGGIGQSRLCMLLLQKAHIGEVQTSVWPQEMIDKCAAHGINIL
ncbi:aspartate--ammonia ligase [Holzapfeliella sp. He02]|uniref:Aspartate--ammonia ligase n=1 Tax=Holzapfeliella saturejae TaxID=3082953 RepID=A0ABU8SHL7_9LACO